MATTPSMVIYDELARARDRVLYDVLDTSMGARHEPLFITISTQSNDPQHILSTLIDDGLRAEDPTTVTHLYAAPDDTDDIFEERVWAKANPALGDFRSLEELRTMAERARRMPAFEASFRNLYLNQRTDAQSPLIPRAEWMACQADGPTLQPGERIYLGLDLSSTTDLSALVAVSAETGERLMAWFWKPKDLIDEHERRDRAPYGVWVREGHLEATPGRAVDYGYIVERLADLLATYTIVAVAYDRWRVENLLRDLRGAGLEAYVDGKETAYAGALRLVPWGQGFRDMGPAVDALEVSILERRLQHPGNPVLTLCFANAVALTDPSGNRKLDKSKTRLRIDGAVAAVMALGLKDRDGAGEPEPSVYEHRGVLTI